MKVKKEKRQTGRINQYWMEDWELMYSVHKPAVLAWSNAFVKITEALLCRHHGSSISFLYACYILTDIQKGQTWNTLPALSLLDTSYGHPCKGGVTKVKLVVVVRQSRLHAFSCVCNINLNHTIATATSKFFTHKYTLPSVNTHEHTF